MTPWDGCCCIGGHNDRFSAYCLWLAIKCPAVGVMGEIRERVGGWGGRLGANQARMSSCLVPFLSATLGFLKSVWTIVNYFLNFYLKIGQMWFILMRALESCITFVLLILLLIQILLNRQMWNMEKQWRWQTHQKMQDHEKCKEFHRYQNSWS